MNYTIQNLSEDEIALIICAVFRENSLVEGFKHYKSGKLVTILEKITEQTGISNGLGKPSILE